MLSSMPPFTPQEATDEIVRIKGFMSRLITYLYTEHGFTEEKVKLYFHGLENITNL